MTYRRSDNDQTRNSRITSLDSTMRMHNVKVATRQQHIMPWWEDFKEGTSSFPSPRTTPIARTRNTRISFGRLLAIHESSIWTWQGRQQQGQISKHHSHTAPRRRGPTTTHMSDQQKGRSVKLVPQPSITRSEPKNISVYQLHPPLNKPKGEIFAVIANELPSPKKIKFLYRERRGNIKYCKYHRDYGHHTDDCYQLKVGSNKDPIG